MTTQDLRKICDAILRNAGIEDYLLVAPGRILFSDLQDYTAMQWVAMRLAGAIWSGRVEPDVASILGFA
ncbi:hypothetical protein ACFL6C_05010 [Myxococcota bacterium]